MNEQRDTAYTGNDSRPAMLATGHPEVDAALGAVAAASDREPSAQVGPYEEAHQVLQDTLATIDRA